MSDRELLEFAAKAAGINVVRSRLDDPMSGDFLVNASARNPHQVSGPWNPLADDGDALRLAVRCAQLFGFYRFLRAWLVAMTTEQGSPSDPYAATRRAIVRAAAEIGRKMS